MNNDTVVVVVVKPLINYTNVTTNPVVKLLTRNTNKNSICRLLISPNRIKYTLTA